MLKYSQCFMELFTCDYALNQVLNLLEIKRRRLTDIFYVIDKKYCFTID